MIHLMECIFTENQFTISRPALLGEQQGFIAISTEQSRTGFFLVLFESENVDFAELNEKLEQYFAEIKRLPEGYDRRMDKNFTLIVCLKRDALSINEVLNRRIFALEEDPYHFRKLVLPFTDQEVRDFRDHHISNGVTAGLYNLISNKEKFFDFKKYPVESTAYNLTSRLFIKLPFLTYRGVEEELDVLSTTIRDRLEGLGLNSIRDSSLTLLDSIQALSPDQSEEKVALFNSWLGVTDDE